MFFFSEFQNRKKVQQFKRISINFQNSHRSGNAPIHLVLKDINFDNPNYNNHLPCIYRNWLQVTNSVDYLRIENTNLFTISRDAFNSNAFKYLHDLVFDTHVGFLAPGAFNGLNSLKRLTFNNASFSSFPSEIFAPLRNMETFTMENCYYNHEILVDNLFRTRLDSLKEVTISNCNLQTINNHTFDGLRNITELHLLKNQIHRIHPSSFRVILKTLNVLDLSYNNITSVPAVLFKARKKEVKINLNMNPWHCDCKLDLLRRFVKFNTNLTFSNFHCATPKEYQSRTLSSLDSLCKEKHVAALNGNGKDKNEEIVDVEREATIEETNQEKNEEKAVTEAEQSQTTNLPIIHPNFHNDTNCNHVNNSAEQFSSLLQLHYLIIAYLFVVFFII